MLFVSLGCNPGGLWFDYGTHQLLCHCNHMGTELLTPIQTPLSKIKHKSKEMEKRAKETEYWIKKGNRRMLISITSGRLFMVKLSPTLGYFCIDQTQQIRAKRKHVLLTDLYTSFLQFRLLKQSLFFLSAKNKRCHASCPFPLNSFYGLFL